MNYDDWEMLWRRQEPPIGKAADLEALKVTFEPKRRKLARAVLVRNLLEGYGGFLMAAIFVGLAWRIGRAAWPILIGAGLILGVSVVFLRDLRRVRRSRLGPEAPMLAKLAAEIAELRHQRRLLSHVGTWYFLPYLAAIVIIGSTLAVVSGRKAPPGLLLELLTTPASLAWIIVMIATIGLALFWAWRANRLAVRKHLDPRLEELEKLQQELTGQP